MGQRPTELLQSFQISFLDVRRLTEVLQRSLNRFASPIAFGATATEHGGQLVSAVDWTLRLLCKKNVRLYSSIIPAPNPNFTYIVPTLTKQL
jgi:hypothetical protein